MQIRRFRKKRPLVVWGLQILARITTNWTSPNRSKQIAIKVREDKLRGVLKIRQEVKTCTKIANRFTVMRIKTKKAT